MHEITRSSLSFDAVVVGAGVFGVWAARSLHAAGKRVAVVEAVGPAHEEASSGGESRIIRCGYGRMGLYSEWARRSMEEWRALSDRSSVPLFHRRGVLWLHRDGDPFVDDSARTLTELEIPFRRLSAAELRARYPVLHVADDETGFLEPRGGGLMARRAVQYLAAELEGAGVSFVEGRVEPIRAASGVAGSLPSVQTVDGAVLAAEAFIIACGPWLDHVCPEAMEGRLFVTRQEVVFFDVDRDRTGALPVWGDLPFYGFPGLDGRGFKVANDTHGSPVDIDRIDRRPGQDAISRASAYLARRFPALADSAVTEGRVCQYANSSNGDFVIDRHPGLDNVWLAGCGSGHGFKHGPAVGAHVAGLLLGTERPIDRFRLGSKKTRQRREIQ